MQWRYFVSAVTSIIVIIYNKINNKIGHCLASLENWSMCSCISLSYCVYLFVCLFVCLFVYQILEYTEPSNADYELLLNAMTLAEDLCTQVNESVKQKENSEKLEWIQTHVQMSVSEVRHP